MVIFVPLYLSQMQLVLKPKKLDSPGHGYMSAGTSVNIYMHIHKCKKKKIKHDFPGKRLIHQNSISYKNKTMD